MKIRLQLFADEAGAAESVNRQTELSSGGVSAEDAPVPDEDEGTPQTTGKAEEQPGKNVQAPPEKEAETTASPEGPETARTDMTRLCLLAKSVASARFSERARQLFAAEEARTRESYPSFCLAREMKDPAFSSLVKLGADVKTAYEAANFEGLLAAAMQYAARKTAEKNARTAPRVEENPVLDRAAGVRKTDVNSLTERDILRIIGEAGKGAKITFR